MILYRPKDVVSGDYYWFSEKDGHVIFTAADCTGHGVPGAFMSMLGMTFLNQVVNEMGETDPGKILDFLRESVIHALKQTGAEGENKDGMDMALFSFKKGDNKIKYAGANNPLVLIRDGEIIEYKADKMPIAIYEKMDPFTTHEVEIQKGDCIYGFSDGYPDQFGGPKGKKFMSKKFKRMLSDIAPKPMKEQEEILNQRILDWMEEGGTEQIDDITVVGVRFN
jgi:serine phosphatase RsbU (regulator of sigma subunit)